MSGAISFIAKYQTWMYALLGAIAVFQVWALWRARRLLKQSAFGLEKETARHKRNGALGMLLIVSALTGFVYMMSHLDPDLGSAFSGSGPTPSATPPHTPTPIVIRATLAPGVTPPPLVADSSGCNNPNATLTQPQSHQMISGSFQVEGTANIPNFAFYKFEISGAPTNGAWVPLNVGNKPVINGLLGSFDASPYEPGEYIFRLVVVDSAGNALPPCAMVVTLVSLVTP
jgi:hypothetical protein